MAKDFYRIAKGACTPFEEKSSKKAILGGKGAGLHDMVVMGLNVPPAFCITTRVCNQYMDVVQGKGSKSPEALAFADNLMEDVMGHDLWLTEVMNYTPLVSVRSGAPVSMPGMMDTILNVGLTTDNIGIWSEKLGERAAWDSYRRLIQMLGATAYGVDMGVFDFQLARIKKDAKVTEDTDLTADHLKTLVDCYLDVFTKSSGHEFPDTREKQLKAAIGAVFRSWGNERAIEYRKINKIDGKMGTACNVQAMVFGNLNDESGTGVLFTRDPSSGENVIMGEFLPNAQGEDVVAGIRTPLNITKMYDMNAPWPKIADEIKDLCQQLEHHYNDMVDIEFTVQDGVLYVLQSRVGKRSAQAAFKIACDLVDDGKLFVREALKRITPEQYKLMRRPTIDPKYKGAPEETGLPACPGVAVGRPVYTSADAVAAKDPVILVTHETDPDDIAGMNKAQGILTATGGATSHAAVVARAMDKPCVVGCTNLDIADMQKAKIEKVTICGASGRVWMETNVPIIDASESPYLKTVQKWAFAETGLYETVIFPDASNPNPLFLYAANWWGDESEMEVAVDSLAGVDDMDHIVLDLSGPKAFAYPEDEILSGAFGHTDPNAFFALKTVEYVITQALDDVSYKGLTLLNAPKLNVSQTKQLKEAGVRVLGRPNTLADVFEGNGAPDKDFIETVIGGDVAWGFLQEMLKAKSVEAKAVPKAAPADYAVFQALS